MGYMMDMSVKNPFALWLTKETNRRRMSDKEIANQSGLSTSVLRDLAEGERYPTAHEISLLKRALPALGKQKGMLVYVAAERQKEIDAKAADKQKAGPDVKTVEIEASPPEKNAPEPEVTVVAAPVPSPLHIDTKRHDEQYTRVEQIDPELAKLLLQGNVRNRDVSSAQVDTFARDMVEGRWRLTHQGIALDREGRLVDGQHRLHAIVLSNTEQRMTVTYNVDPESFQVVDTSMRPRSAVDVLRMAERAGTPLVSTHASTATAAAVKVIGNAVRNQAINKWSLAEVSELLNRYPDVEVVAKMCKKSKESRRAGVVAGMTYAYPIYPDVVTDFCQRISTSEGMSKLHAAFLRAASRIDQGTVGNIEVMLLTLRAVHRAKFGNLDLQKLYMKEGNFQEDASVQHFVHMRTKKGLPI